MAERKGGMHATARFLVSKGICAALADDISQELTDEDKEIFETTHEPAEALRKTHFKEALPQLLQMSHLKEKIMQRLRITGELCLEKPRKLVLVGPTGVGKTTTLMKLASHYLKQNKKVALVTLDVGKKRVLEKWAELQKIPFFATVPHTHFDLLLIDTEGCNFYQPNRVEALGDKLATCVGDAEVLLTLSASAKEVDLYGAVHQFSPLKPSSLVFTKLDETLAAGVLVNVCAKTDIPIRYISFGYPLPGDLQVADAKLITHKILTDFNKEEFQILRQLSTLN